MSFNSLAVETTLLSVVIRFFTNLIVLFILIRVIYYKYSKKEEYVFSFFLMGIIIFLLCSLLETVDIKLGMALGLFAVFAILRFRTVNYTVKDMTYTFTVIGISVVNSQANIPPPVAGAIIFNSIIVIAAYLLEIFLQKRTHTSMLVNYHKLELLKPSFKKDLIRDLSDETGQQIDKVIIRKMDVGKKNAELEIFFLDKESN
jgi:hypothetical protein